MHNLSRAVDIDARLSRLDERSRHVQINDESLCDSCNARLGTKLFAMYPDDCVVCYKVWLSSSQLMLEIELLSLPFMSRPYLLCFYAVGLLPNVTC